MKQAIRALNNTLKQHFSESEIDMLEFYPDIETDETYTWKFRFPDKGKTYIYTYHKKNKKVLIREAY